MMAKPAASSPIEPLRVALITPGFSADERDWAIPALLDLVRVLAEAHDVHVFTLRYPHRRDRYEVAGAAVHALGYGTRGRAWRVPLLADALAAVGLEHRRRPFDLLHGLWADEPGFVAVAAANLLGRRAVVSLLGGELVGYPDIGYGGQLSRINRRLTATALTRASFVTVGSRFLRGLAAPYVPAERLVTLPLGVDLDRFSPQPASVHPPGSPSDQSLAGSPALLHVASLTPIKDQTTLLGAVALAAEELPSLQLHVVGDGQLQPDLADLARSLGLAARVTFHGHVPHDQLPPYYHGADLLVLSSRFESQNLALLEAAACACPAVGTAVGLLPELLGPDRVVPVGDPQALAHAILQHTQSPERLAAMRSPLHQQALRGYSLAETVRALVELYRRVCRHVQPSL